MSLTEELNLVAEDGDSCDSGDETHSSHYDTPPASPSKWSGSKALDDTDGIKDDDEGRGKLSKGGKTKHLEIIATGKGRGRPKKIAKLDGDQNANDEVTAKIKTKKTSTGKGRGRPKKVKNSDDESSDDKNDDEEEKRPVGRPSTGAVQLNILGTGRGQGRPKQKKKDGGPTGKPRGRPPIGKTAKAAYVPTGKPRGRPKSQPAEVENGKATNDSSDE